MSFLQDGVIVSEALPHFTPVFSSIRQMQNISSLFEDNRHLGCDSCSLLEAYPYFEGTRRFRTYSEERAVLSSDTSVNFRLHDITSQKKLASAVPCYPTYTHYVNLCTWSPLREVLWWNCVCSWLQRCVYMMTGPRVSFIIFHISKSYNINSAQFNTLLISFLNR
jgi:hypothetical protein